MHIGDLPVKIGVMRETADIEKALHVHGDAVWRACRLYFPSEHDAQDAYQETFVRYSSTNTVFADDEHQKAWLIRVATNVCRDMLRSMRRATPDSRTIEEASLVSPEDPETSPASVRSEVVDALRSLPDPPRTPLYLSICEEYPATEIAKMMNASVNTVYTWIARGRKQLKRALS